jgi:hypothetical protein
MPLTSLDGLLKFEVFTGDRTPLDPLMLYQTAEETVGIIDFALDQRFNIEWELVAGWNSLPENGSREYDFLQISYFVNGIITSVRRGGSGYWGWLLQGGLFPFKDARATHCKAHLKFEFLGGVPGPAIGLSRRQVPHRHSSIPDR